MIEEISLESINFGFQRMADFNTLHKGHGLEPMQKALATLQEGMGLSAESRQGLYEQILSFDAMDGDLENLGWMLCGVMIGFLIIDHQTS